MLVLCAAVDVGEIENTVMMSLSRDVGPEAKRGAVVAKTAVGVVVAVDPHPLLNPVIPILQLPVLPVYFGRSMYSVPCSCEHSENTALSKVGKAAHLDIIYYLSNALV